jgi:hypothetical protein
MRYLTDNGDLYIPTIPDAFDPMYEPDVEPMTTDDREEYTFVRDFYS